MSKQTLIKLCLYVIILTGLDYALPVTAGLERLPKPQETLQCGNGSASRYEMWVKDLPCDPLQSRPDYDVPESVSGGDALVPEDMEPNPELFTDLVFSRFVDGNWEIYGNTHPWGSDGVWNSIRMTNDASSDLRPRLRPGSSQVVFASDRSGNYELYSMDWGGGSLQQLTWNEGYDSQAAWSPDGSRLVLVDELDGNLEIAVMQADGSGWTRLTYDSSDDFDPSWSPDGTKLIWVKVYDDYHGVIYTMNADGSNQQPLTGPLLYAEHPYWSIDGSMIAYDYDHNQDYWLDLVKLNLDGSGTSILRGGYSYADFWAGTWTRLPYTDLLFTEFMYAEDDGQLYLLNICIGSYSLSSGGGSCFQTSYLDAYPDASSSDISIPETHFLPLPEYSRAGDIDLTLTGYDAGPAEIYLVRTETRLGADGEWQYWDHVGYQPTMHLTYTAQAGETVYFRSAGWDWADHWEAYEEGDGDTHTTTYAWQLNGKIMDNRGIGIPEASINMEPGFFADQQEANLEGEFHRYVPTNPIEVSISGSGYIVTDPTPISSNIDVQFLWALEPTVNNLSNGEFESDLNGWFNIGDRDAFLDDELSHTGQSSAALGMTYLGVGAENISDSSGGSGSLSVVLDAHGTLHAVWGDNEGASVGSIYYSQKPITGTWSTPSIVNPIHTKSSWQPDLAVGPDGTLHAVWVDSDYEGIIVNYAHRSVDGTWSEAEELTGLKNTYGNDADPYIVIDSLNTAHVIWADGEGLFYINKVSQGAWSQPYKLDGYCEPHSIVIDASDTLHFAYSNNEGVIYRTRSADGNWSQPEIATSEEGCYALDMDVDSQGNVHLVWRFEPGTRYTKRTAPGSWSIPALLTEPHDDFEISIIASDENVDFIWRGDSSVKFRRQFPDGNWSDPVLIANPELGFGVGISLILLSDKLCAFWSEVISYSPYNTDIMFSEWSLLENTRTSLSNRTGVVDWLHDPTLSFHFYAQQEGTGGDFTVQVNDTTVFTAEELLPAWNHYWVDMAPWLGQLVTVTFTVENDLSKGMLQVNIDDVSLGSWLTPLVDGVSPGTFEEWSSIVLTITGENFMESPSVRIGETEFNNVIRIDEHTLQVEIPSGMAPGIYSVRVVNAGDWVGVWHGYLRVGELRFIPCLVK